jgi:hypothetical protein
MRLLVALTFGVLAILSAIGAGIGVVLVRNVVEPEGFTRTVVAIVQSPEGQRFVAREVGGAVEAEAAGLPAPIATAAGAVAGTWAAAVLASPEAARVLAPTAIALQRGLLIDEQTGSAAIDLRSLAAAAPVPAEVEAVLVALPGEVVVDVPWLQVDGRVQFILRQLDRHRVIPAVLAGSAVILALIAISAARRRGLAVLLLGGGLVAAVLLVHLYGIRDPSVWFASSGAAARGLEVAAVREVLRGWNAVGGALVVIGVAIAILGAVVGVGGRSRRSAV